jgi:hypothetical protein
MLLSSALHAAATIRPELVEVPSVASGVRHSRAAGSPLWFRCGADQTRAAAHDPGGVGHASGPHRAVGLPGRCALGRGLAAQPGQRAADPGVLPPQDARWRRARRVHGRGDAGRRLRPARSARADRCASVRGLEPRFTPMHAARSETELHGALDEVDRALALWRATRWRTWPAWTSPAARPPGWRSCGCWRRNAVPTCCFASAATATRSASSPSWSDRCRCVSDSMSSSCWPCTGRAARPTPCATTGRPGARWWRSSASSPARTCVTWNDGSSTRTRPWTGSHRRRQHLSPS